MQKSEEKNLRPGYLQTVMFIDW